MHAYTHARTSTQARELADSSGSLARTHANQITRARARTACHQIVWALSLSLILTQARKNNACDARAHLHAGELRRIAWPGELSARARAAGRQYSCASSTHFAGTRPMLQARRTSRFN